MLGKKKNPTAFFVIHLKKIVVSSCNASLFHVCKLMNWCACHHREESSVRSPQPSTSTSTNNAQATETQIWRDWPATYCARHTEPKTGRTSRGTVMFLTRITRGNNFWNAAITGTLKPQAEKIIAEEQAGLRAGRSTTEQIFNLRILSEKYLQHQRDLYHVFIDFKKAFGRVWHAALWATMKKYNISTNLIQVIKNLYNKATSAVLFNDSIGD